MSILSTLTEIPSLNVEIDLNNSILLNLFIQKNDEIQFDSLIDKEPPVEFTNPRSNLHVAVSSRNIHFIEMLLPDQRFDIDDSRFAKELKEKAVINDIKLVLEKFYEFIIEFKTCHVKESKIWNQIKKLNEILNYKFFHNDHISYIPRHLNVMYDRYKNNWSDLQHEEMLKWLINQKSCLPLRLADVIDENVEESFYYNLNDVKNYINWHL